MTTHILQGNCLDTLKTLADCSVQCVVTSPPYYALRDYGTAVWIGGKRDCDHLRNKAPNGNLNNQKHAPFKNECGKCGAVRTDEQIGLETTPGEYVAKLVLVFREIWRVLKDDGTLWVNLGDSYATAGSRQADKGLIANRSVAKHRMRGYRPLVEGCKPKDLIGIPWMVAFALRENGWYLRSEIIWHKPNPMPESVTDRPTKAHEQIFLLSKKQKYYYDAEAILEPVTGGTHARISQNLARQVGSFRANGGQKTNGTMKAVIRAPKMVEAGSGNKNNTSFNNALLLQVEQRNKRSVWTITTKPYKEAHFATFPPDLIEPCILAGSRVGDTVLDPFNGSGTTGAVAIKHHRDYIGCELNPEYVKLTNKRFSKVQPVLFVKEVL